MRTKLPTRWKRDQILMGSGDDGLSNGLGALPQAYRLVQGIREAIQGPLFVLQERLHGLTWYTVRSTP